MGKRADAHFAYFLKGIPFGFLTKNMMKKHFLIDEILLEIYTFHEFDNENRYQILVYMIRRLPHEIQALQTHLQYNISHFSPHRWRPYGSGRTTRGHC
ncbi:hypothetical protein EMIT07CA2_30139 [Brevibacillus sp. IT-7CA2]